ncbi:unnamed protein product [Allacma fusca]|uniref:ABC transporter domain-containing protein n=1 Tax=Allacma fusca TaxID=39272 RepID=A0A8J2PVY4_9HEXA|nr:unnamed protein product [Allacma fusca]
MQFVLNNSFTARGLQYNFIAFPRVGELMSTYKEQYTDEYADSTQEVLAGVIFTNVGAKHFPENIKYTLKFPASQRTKYNLLVDQGNARPNWFTDLPWPKTSFGGPRSQKSKHGGFPGYFDEGYLYLQHAINEAVVKSLLNSTEASDLNQYNLRLQRFPAPPYTDDNFSYIFQFITPLVITAAFTYNVLELTKQIIQEKSSRLKEFMKIMGLRNWQHWLAWFIRSYIPLLITVTLLVIILKIELKDKTSVLTHSDPLVVLVLFSVHALNVITYSFVMSTLFANENAGSTVAAITWVMSGFHSYSFLHEYYKTTFWGKVLGCFLAPNTPIIFILNFIHHYESFGKGLHWNNMWHAIYIELAFPGKYGIGLPWYFPFTVWFWTGERRSPKMVHCIEQRENSDAFEEEPQNLESRVVIKNLTKIFGSKVAISNFNFNMYNNQVTSLLGPNGAGKTTIMSILTGLIRPTAGVVRINSYDITTDITHVRSSIGFCPQYNMLFDNLTVEEHLKFYCLIKGLNEAETLNEIERWVNTLGLDDKRKTLSKYLSGGMKRKLCIGIALSAGSKFVLLDEPTAGVDPEARRAIWGLIQAEKKGRTIILSTHYMEEADLLGDKIAIMADGRLLCSGSSLFLKSIFGNSYNLVIVKSEEADSDAIKAMITGVIPSVELRLVTRTEISWTLPAKEVELLPIIFEKLETYKNELGIRTYTIGSIPLQEIFFRITSDSPRNTLLRVGSHSIENMLTRSTSSINLDNASLGSISQLCRYDIKLNQGFSLLWQQFCAMVKKKLRVSFRNKSIILLQAIIPVFGIIGLQKIVSLSATSGTPKLDINSVERVHEIMGTSTALFNCLPKSDICQALRSTLQGYHYSKDVEDTSVVTALLAELTEINRRDESKYLLAFEEDFNQTGNQKQLTVLFNNQPFHIPPLALNVMFNGLLNFYGLKNRITTSNHPFDFTPIDDLRSFPGPSCHCTVTIIFDIHSYTSWEVRLGVVIIVSIFGVAAILLCMLMSTLMNDPTIAYARILAINILGLIAIVSHGLLKSPDLSIQDTVNAIHDVFSYVPVYAASMAIYSLGQNRQLKTSCSYVNTTDLCHVNPGDQCCFTDKGYYAWDEPGISKYLVRMSGLSALFMILLIIRETELMSKITRLFFRNKRKWANANSDDLELMDADVLAESQRINHCTLATLNSTDNLIVKGLTKTYKGKNTVVNNLNFGVKKGEAFGLLGINGAGKTSTFKMLTGNASITSGDAYVNYCSVKLDQGKARSYLGYCPQFDACIDELTGRETLTFFAQLKGIPEEKINELVKRTSETLLFRQYLDKQFATLSGGSRRKLSTAVAMLGEPTVILLDEPTAGMDPISTRHVWNAISMVRDTGKSILLTSHNMEECEALCSTLAIMVKGRLKCLGSPQHLKSTMLRSYKLIIQLPFFQESVHLQDRDKREDSESLMRRVKLFLEQRFPGCVLTDSHWGFLEYLIPTGSVTWAKVFVALQEAKDLFSLKGYSIGHVDLEQVFLKFA